MAPSKMKRNIAKVSRREEIKKTIKNNFNYFELPPPVHIPKYPIPYALIPVVIRNLQACPQMSLESVQFLSILEQLKNNNIEMTKDNYLKILKLLLYVEQIQNDTDMKRYDQTNKKIERVSRISDKFMIYVDGLEEDRPSIRPEDEVEVRDANTGTKFVFRVVNVASKYILACAGKRFRDHHRIENLYNIRFRYPTYTTRCSHYALTLTAMHELTPNFFPEKRLSIHCPSNIDYWFNKSIENNPEQKQAVINIVSQTSRPAPYILYGPPGTGKTATLVEAICQIFFSNSSDVHILVCTPSNSAADVITKRLLDYEIPDNSIYRMYSPSKEGSKIDSAIVECSNYVNGQVMMLPEELVKEKSIVLCTLCAAVRFLFMRFKEKHFSYVFIDEAGQATEPDSLIPFNLMTSIKEGRIGRLHGHVVIAGDPKQLGPGIRSKIAEPMLGRSLLERLMECEPYRKNEHNKYNPSFITKLLQNYRSHPTIIHVSNQLFYENELIPCAGERARKAEDYRYLPKPKFPIIFHGTEGVEQQTDRSPSIFNKAEIRVVMDYVKSLIGQRFGKDIVKGSDIGIITPFAEQRLKLHNALNEDGLGNVTVGTVELFQGQEKDIIIMSTVRSEVFKHDNRYHIGFLSNPKRFNVALTRAKNLLIVIGDPNVLKVDVHWRYFLKFCQANQACRGTYFEISDDMDILVKQIYSEKHRTRKIRRNIDLDIININDGIQAYSDSESEENDHPTASNNFPANSNGFNPHQTNGFNHSPQFNVPRTNGFNHNVNQRPNKNKNYRYDMNGRVSVPSTSNNILSDLIDQKLQEMEINGPEDKKKQKKKRNSK